MKRFLILLTLPILAACGGFAKPIAPTITPLSPPTVAPPQGAVLVPQTQPAPDTAAAPATEPPIVYASSFPNAANYEWALIASGLTRPVDVQPANDGSGRLFIIEKMGYIRAYENGNLLTEPFLDITDRVNADGNEMGL
ncbi:MAG: hypothetical protein Q7T89_03350, partial [Anaerolineales bacterium]|nr:hypothetical protein [Anaerolineales bacterium]